MGTLSGAIPETYAVESEKDTKVGQGEDGVAKALPKTDGLKLENPREKSGLDVGNVTSLMSDFCTEMWLIYRSRHQRPRLRTWMGPMVVFFGPKGSAWSSIEVRECIA